MKNRVWIVSLFILSVFSSSSAFATNSGAKKISTPSVEMLEKVYLAAEKSKVGLQKRGKDTTDIDIVINASLLSLMNQKNEKQQTYWAKIYSKLPYENINYTAEDYSRVFDLYARKVVRTNQVKAILGALNEAILQLEENQGNASGMGSNTTSDCLPGDAGQVLSSSARDALFKTGWMGRMKNAVRDGYRKITHRKKARRDESVVVSGGGDLPVGGFSSNFQSDRNSGGTAGKNASRGTLATQGAGSGGRKSSSASGESFKGGSALSAVSEIPRGHGLRNLGNTCFANSVHQLWYYSPVLRKILEDRDDDTPEVRELRKRFRAIMSKMQTGDKARAEAELRGFFAQFNSLGGFFQVDPQQQEDASEYLVPLLGYFSNNTYNPIKIEKTDLFEGEKNPVARTNADINSHLIISTHGLKKGSKPTAQYLVDQAMREETIEGREDPRIQNKTEREKNKKKSQVSSHLIVPESGLPEEVLFHIVRTDHELRKIDLSVDLSQPIDPRFETKDFTRVPQSYIPFAFVVHHGNSPRSGHYITYTHDLKTDTWYKHDDSTVREVKKSEALGDINKNAIVVNYVKAAK